MGLPFHWRYRTTVLGLCMAVYFGARFGQVALGALGPEIVASLDTTMGRFGLAFTALSLAAAAVQFPSGAASDKYGERRLVLAAVLLTGASTLGLAFAPGYAAFLPLMVAVGLGSGLYYSPSTVLLDELYDGIGRAIGTYRISGQLAGVVAPVAVGVIGVRYGWRAVLLASGLVLVPVLVGLVAFMRPTPPNDPDARLLANVSPRRLRDLLSRPGLAWTTLLASVVQFVDVASFTFLPAVLQRYHGLSPAGAGALYALYFGVVATAQPLSGWLSDQFGRDPVIAGTLLAGTVGYTLLAGPLPEPALVVAVVFAGVSMTWAAPVQSRLLDVVGDAERGVGFGLVRTVYLLVGALGGVVVGTLVTATGWGLAFGALAALLGLPLVGLAANGLRRAI